MNNNIDGLCPIIGLSMAKDAMAIVPCRHHISKRGIQKLLGEPTISLMDIPIAKELIFKRIEENGIHCPLCNKEIKDLAADIEFRLKLQEIENVAKKGIEEQPSEMMKIPPHPRQSDRESIVDEEERDFEEREAKQPYQQKEEAVLQKSLPPAPSPQEKNRSHMFNNRRLDAWRSSAKPKGESTVPPQNYPVSDYNDLNSNECCKCDCKSKCFSCADSICKICCDSICCDNWSRGCLTDLPKNACKVLGYSLISPTLCWIGGAVSLAMQSSQCAVAFFGFGGATACAIFTCIESAECCYSCATGKSCFD